MEFALKVPLLLGMLWVPMAMEMKKKVGVGLARGGQCSRRPIRLGGAESPVAVSACGWAKWEVEWDVGWG
jgi:hypothetical protein